VAFAVDDGEAVLQGDLVLVEGVVDGVIRGVGRAPGAVSMGGSDAAMDSASTRALDEVYWASSRARRLESLRISLGFCENQRSTARFIRP
jgi:hypothetical protein